MNYEIQIFAKDRSKIIRFEENEQDSSSFKKQMAWEDFYHALGSVIDDKADKIRENNTLIGRIHVRDMRFDDVIDAMSEDLTPDLLKLLVKGEEEVLVA
ncbi:MAG: hypothetical protein EAZ95_05205 [Bacteroidetes bacterium]|nr:MAG: hypothetical protein EAZ95_05205 [Bacteroidota bacterium]